MDNWYSLRIAIENEKYDEAINLLQKFSKGIISDRKTFYSSLLVLANVGYATEVKEILKDTYNPRSDVDLKKIINNSISEYEMKQSLTEEQKDIADRCIEMIREALDRHEYDLVYDLCEWGYYVSQLPIFLYYEGKGFYRCHNYVEAEKTLLKYVELGSVKTPKAYLYLAQIFKLRKDKPRYLKYKKKVEEVNVVYSNPYYFYDFINSGIDRKKCHIQLNKFIV